MLAKIEKARLQVQLDEVEVIEEHDAYVWYEDLEKILKSKTVKWFKFFAGKKVKRILEIADKIVGLIAFIQHIGGWEKFKAVILQIIEIGGIDETIKKLEKK
ncbi:hypothetical protein WAF17_16400 [Bernardetia sp. ABR2-2B]|uniref:hypothetical protein n=1 Tax=Bernardetia sp. ABR2-2B TaxID=3127472 RepID=UPI0030CF470D